jgi:hypothetical protein
MLRGTPPNLIQNRSKLAATHTASSSPYKLEQEVSLEDFPATASIDSQARGGNWIARSIADMAKLKPHPCLAMEFESPLFNNMSVLSNSGVTVPITFHEWDLTVRDTLFRIIIGTEFINKHRLLDYIVNPTVYKRIVPPGPAPEDNVAAEVHNYLTLPASILQCDYPSVGKIEPVTPWWEQAIHPDFPMREQAAKLLREFEGSVLVHELQHSTITGIPDFDMDVTKPFTGVKPRRMSEAKENFLRNWLQTMERNGIIRKSTAKATSPLLLVPKG